MVEDPQVVANGYLVETATAAGIPFKLVATPVQFGGEPATPNGLPNSTNTATRFLPASTTTPRPSSTSRSKVWWPEAEASDAQQLGDVVMEETGRFLR